MIEPGTNLEVLYRLKLVGLVINSDMTLNDHIYYAIGRVIKFCGNSTGSDRYEDMGKQVKSILMFGVFCYYSCLTNEARAPKRA